MIVIIVAKLRASAEARWFQLPAGKDIRKVIKTNRNRPPEESVPFMVRIRKKKCMKEQEN
jgi:hypothetical protein